MYGVASMTEWHDSVMFSKTSEEAPELYKMASPLTYVHADSTPLLILHGTADKTPWMCRSRSNWVELLKAAGAV